MAQATSFGKNVINLKEWLASKKPKKLASYIPWDQRQETRTEAVLSAVTYALNKVHHANPDQHLDPRTP